MPGQHARVRLGLDARDHAHEHVVLGPRRLEPVDVVGVVDDDEADPVLGRERDLLVALRVAVQHEQRRVGAGRDRGHDLAAARDVEPEPLLDHHALHRRAGERLRREHDARARPARRQPVAVLARTGAQRVLRHDHHRRAELGRERVRPAPADAQHPVVAGVAPGREQGQQGVHGAGKLSPLRRRLRRAARSRSMPGFPQPARRTRSTRCPPRRSAARRRSCAATAASTSAGASPRSSCASRPSRSCASSRPATRSRARPR